MSCNPITPRPTRRSPSACFLLSSRKYGVASITLSCIRTPTFTVLRNASKLTVFVSLFANFAKLTAAKLHTEYGANGCSKFLLTLRLFILRFLHLLFVQVQHTFSLQVAVSRSRG